MNNEVTIFGESQQKLSSLEIAELTGKQHKDVLKAIRNMEEAWVKVCGRKFALTSRTISIRVKTQIYYDFKQHSIQR